MGNTGSELLSKHESGFLCTLCRNAYRNPFTLKCKHRFCKSCIGELWSDSATGPYFCPECRVEYKSLPFERDPVRPIRHVGLWRTRAPNVNTSPAVTRLLGKRAASSPAPDQPCDSKRLATGLQGPASDRETPTTSSSVSPSRPPDPGPSTQEERPPSERPGGTSVPTPTDVKSPREDKHDETSAPVKNDAPPAKETPASPAKTPEKMLTPAEQDQRTGHERETARETDKPPPAATGFPASPSLSPGPKAPNLGPVLTPKAPSLGPVPTPKAPSPGPVPAPKAPSLGPVLTPKTPSLGPVPAPKAPSLGPVPCNYCPSTGPLPAVKTCLVCGASMCADHLRPHLESPVFRSHALVAPVEDMSPWRCGEHQEMTRIYCRQCAACVCTVCTVIGSHRDHACVSIREAERELRENLKDQMTHLQDTEQALVSRVSELADRKRASQLVLKEARAGVQQQYSAMREFLEQEEQQALLCVSQEESRAVGSLEGPLSLLQDSLASVQQGLHALEGLADATGAERMQDQAFIAEYSKVTQSVSERQCGVEELKAPEEVNQARLTSLQQWTERRLDSVVVSLPDRDSFRLLYGIRPSLDPDTAHPKLLLSEENRMVVYTEAPHDYPEQGARFTGFPQVLASQSLEEGRWYWEVDVPGELGRWKLGVCEARIARKGQKDNCRIGFNPCSWCLVSDRGKLEVLHDKVVVPVSADELCKVGVFLDFEGGSLSFYRVAQGGAITLLHSFQQRFTEPLYPALAVSRTRLVISDLFHTPASD